MHILAIDAEPLMGAVLRMMLAPDHEVTLVTTEMDALALLRTGTFALVICDIKVPAFPGVTRTLFLSDLPHEGSLVKPFSREELREAVAAALA